MGISFDPGDVNENDDREVILKSSTGANLLGAALSAASLPVVLSSDHAIISTQARMLGYDKDNDSWENIRLDRSTRAVEVIDYVHHEMHNGSHYFVKSFDNSSATVLDFLWSVPDSATLPHATWIIDSEVEFTLELYEGTVVSANGTTITSVNNNRNSTNTAGVAAFSGPTITSLGTLVWSGKIGSGKTATSSRDLLGEFLGKRNTKYLFRLTKNVAGTYWVDWTFAWYEHADAG